MITPVADELDARINLKGEGPRDPRGGTTHLAQAHTKQPADYEQAGSQNCWKPETFARDRCVQRTSQSFQALVHELKTACTP